MKTLAFTAPILPGKTADGRRFSKEIAGPRYKEMTESRRALGQTRETTWIQSTPQGDILVVYLEGADSVRANKQFSASKSPFDLWFKQQAQSFTGIDFNQPLPEGFVEVIHEAHASDRNANVLCIAFPNMPRKTEAWRQWAKELTGPRLGEFNDYLRRTNIMESWYLQHTPQGDVVVIRIEGENPAGALKVFATSDLPFDKWNREILGPIHGVDFGQPLPGLPELGFDWRA